MNRNDFNLTTSHFGPDPELALFSRTPVIISLTQVVPPPRPTDEIFQAQASQFEYKFAMEGFEEALGLLSVTPIGDIILPDIVPGDRLPDLHFSIIDGHKRFRALRNLAFLSSEWNKRFKEIMVVVWRRKDGWPVTKREQQYLNGHLNIFSPL